MNNNNKPITVFEHTRLSIGEQGFEEKHFNTLVKYNDLHGGKYFSVGYRKIHFKSYVGVIQAGDKVIEVLPKADTQLPANEEYAKRKWQGALLYMLQQAGYIKLNQTDKAALHTDNNQLLDVYLSIFLKEAEQLIHAGLVKKYRRTRQNQNALKGRLLIEKQIQHNTIHKERFYTEHTIYDRNNTYNQILKAALKIIADTSLSTSIKQDASGLLLYFDGLDIWKGNESDFDKIKLDRKTLPYKYALELARMIILNYCPDMSAGKKHVLALLFDMNVLFEKFIFRVLKKHEGRFGAYQLSVSPQNREKFWAHKTIRPDIIIIFKNEDEEYKMVIDTKWKIVDDCYPSDDDLKQMFTYNIQLGTNHAVLLYPYAGQTNAGRKKYHKSQREVELNHSCEMYFIRLFADNNTTIDTQFAYDFLAYSLHALQANGPGFIA